MLRHDWTYEEIKAVYDLPFPDLIFKAQLVHRENFSHLEVQRSTLLSVKTGGCPENCAYCPQSAHYDTGVEKHKLLPVEVVLVHAREAKSQGSTRFCMGAAWREVKDGAEFDNLVDIVSQVHNLGLEVCCTLGMLNADQANRLKDAGCYAYNHNLDTSPEYYSKIITTRTYQDRLDTIDNVRASGMTVCCGGIVGLGEEAEDRIKLIKQLSSLNPHPESVPVNMLVQVEGTPLKGEETVDPIDFIRMIAVARIVMPKSMVRLSAGRKQMSDELQALAFCAGANSIFAGEKLLTTLNPTDDQDRRLLNRLGMKFVERASDEEDTVETAACQTSCCQTSNASA